MRPVTIGQVQYFEDTGETMVCGDEMDVKEDSESEMEDEINAAADLIKN